MVTNTRALKPKAYYEDRDIKLYFDWKSKQFSAFELQEKYGIKSTTRLYQIIAKMKAREDKESETKCPQCGKVSDTVKYRQNAYDNDVNNDPDSYWTACDECDDQNKLDI